MSHRKSGVIFSATSGNSTSVSDGAAGNGPKLGMMSVVNNEYSDMEEDEEEEINSFIRKSPFDPVNSHLPSNKSNSQANKTQSPMVSQYGIGAKLLMGMGYQEGKGLGSKKDGIAVPIETKLRPQGLGVGGIRENPTNAKKQEISSSDDEIPGPTPVSFSKPTYDLFSVIDSLESAGVEVPIYYKELSDNATTNANPLELEKAHTKLSAISSQVMLIDAKIRNLQLEIGHTDRSLESQNLEKATLESLIEKLRLVGHDISSTSIMLEELTTEPYASLPDIQTIFVAYAKPHVTALFSSSFSQETLNQLLQWAVLYRNLESEHASTVLNPWDSLIVQLVKSNLERLQNSEYDLRFWLDSPVVVNSPLVEHFSLEEFIMPALLTTLGNWDLLRGFESSIIESLADFDWDDTQRRQIVDAVANKYEMYFSQCWRELSNECGHMWAYYERNMRPVLDHFSLLGVLLIEQYHEQKANQLRKLLNSDLLAFCQGKQTTNDIDRTLALILEFQHSFNLISPVQLEIIILFTVLNPMVKILSQLLLESKSPMALFYRWQELFALLSQEYPEVKDMLLWYTNVLIETLRCFRQEKPVSYRLPAYNQDEFPVGALEKLVLGNDKGTSSVYSIAVLDLLVTFKDVVQQMCLQRNVVFQGTGRQDEHMNEILQLRFASGESHECYISHDVLWVRGALGFFAVDLLEFLDRHA